MDTSKPCCAGTTTSSTTTKTVDSMLAKIAPIMVSPYGSGMKCLEFTMLPGTPITVHDDGSIEYEPRDVLPPDISGYVRDAGNPFLFHPEWPECDQRYHGTKRLPEGYIDVVMVCGCTEVPQYKSTVHVNECRACPFAKRPVSTNAPTGSPR